MAFQRIGVLVVMGVILSISFLVVLNGQLFSRDTAIKRNVNSEKSHAKDELPDEPIQTEEHIRITIQEEHKPVKLMHPRPEVNEISSLSVALVIMEGSQRPGIDGAITSVILNTPYNWPLYVIYPSKIKSPTFDGWVRNLPFTQVSSEQQRPVIFRDMPDKYYGQSQNVPASDLEFWNSFSEDWILLFQADSSMCGHPTIHLKNFFQYDYVGAPWRQYQQWDNEGNGAEYYGNRVYAGNGGFSLRRRAWMIECLQRGGFRAPEDTFFALCTQQHGKSPSTHEAMPFSSEQIATPGGALGIHGICTYRFQWGCRSDWVEEWLKTCPESSFLFPNHNRCPHC